VAVAADAGGMADPEALRKEADRARRHADLLGDEAARARLIALAEELERKAEAEERARGIPPSRH